jgi:glycosyltransferase involved in cell wall biosynthesis
MKLSVAMITYNQERYIGQAIESVLAQSVNFDYEIVIGEDCSTDSTREIVMNFARGYPNCIVPLVRDHNLGGPRNLDATLASCRGQYVALLEGDDYWTSVDKLQKQVDFLDAHPDRALCCHRVKFVNEIDPADFYIYPPRAAGAYTLEDLLQANFVVTCSVVMRRELMGDVPMWLSEMKVGDWARSALVARHGTIELMDESMATYRVHPGGVWTSLSPSTQLLEVTRMLRRLDEHLGFQYTNAIWRTITWPYLEKALTARSNGRRVDAAKHLVNCMWNGGLRSRWNWRPLAGLAAYAVFGPWYEAARRAGRTVFR